MNTKIAAYFMILTGFGFIFSLVAHIASIIGVSVFGQEPSLYNLGIKVFTFASFVVLLATAPYFRTMTKEFSQNQKWETAFRGCPKYMKYISYGLLAYFALTLAFFITHPLGIHTSTWASGVQVFSILWLLMYQLAFALLYSYIQIQRQGS